MKALARRLSAIEHKRAQHQHRRIVWPTMPAGRAAGPDTGARGMGKNMGKKAEPSCNPHEY